MLSLITKGNRSLPKYSKKSVIVEAEQWFPDKPMDGVVQRPGSFFGHLGDQLTGEIVAPGDYVVTDVYGRQSVKVS